MLRRTCAYATALVVTLAGLLATGCDDPTGVIPHGGIHFRDRNLERAVRMAASKQYGQPACTTQGLPLGSWKRLAREGCCMASKTKTQNEKLQAANKGVRFFEAEGGRGVMPEPSEYDELICTVPEGRLVTMGDLRRVLAARHDAVTACPWTAGILVNLIARASDERAMLGQKPITPYWRVLKADGELNDKFPGGTDVHKALLEAEGHSVVQKGKRYFVPAFATCSPESFGESLA